MNTGEQQFEFIQEKELKLTNYDVIILDEYSMLSKENFQDLQKAIQGSDTQIIFVGDSQHYVYSTKWNTF
jgi:ATP-dependent exoDNAse (exonuclease V) alpha subunit